MRSREELVNRVAKFLGKLVAGQPLEAEDYASIDDELESVIENLSSRGIVYVPDLDSIDDGIFLPLARVIAAAVCSDFAVPLASIAGFVGPTPETTEPRKSEIELRVMGRNPPSNDTIRVVNF